MESQQGLLRKAPVAGVSTPVSGQAGSSSGPKTNSSLLKMTAPEAATPSVTDNEVPNSILQTLRLLDATMQMLKWEHKREIKLKSFSFSYSFFTVCSSGLKCVATRFCGKNCGSAGSTLSV